MKFQIQINKNLLYALIYLFLGFQSGMAINSEFIIQEKKVKVLFIFNNNEKKELVGIVKYSYLDKSENVEKFYKTYPNHFFYSGYVIGKMAKKSTGSKKIINGIYEEPKIGDLLIIYAQTEKGSAKQDNVRIPFGCEKKGDQCMHITDTDFKLEMQVIEDLWNSNKGYSTISTFRINSIQQGEHNTEKIYFNKPLYGKDKH